MTDNRAATALDSAVPAPSLAPVRKSITVRSSVENAFRVFTEDMDSWWPRSHHIGKSPMKRALIEGFVGGRCYTEQVDGTDCQWGSVVVWEPPRRFVFAWQIDHTWQFVTDLSAVSEVEVRFTPVGDGQTRVDLEHRNFERMGPMGATMRAGVDTPDGWSGKLTLYAERANAAPAAGASAS